MAAILESQFGFSNSRKGELSKHPTRTVSTYREYNLLSYETNLRHLFKDIFEKSNTWNRMVSSFSLSKAEEELLYEVIEVPGVLTLPGIVYVQYVYKFETDVDGLQKGLAQDYGFFKDDKGLFRLLCLAQNQHKWL